MTKGSARSVHLTPQALTLLLAVFLIHSVWRQSGSRLAIVAAVGVIVALVTNLVWAALATRHLMVDVVDCPHDVTAGSPVTCELRVTGSRAPVELRMLSSPNARWHRVDGPDTGSLTVLAPARGVATAAVFQAICTAPLGLLGMSRKFVVGLPHPLHIGPHPEVVTGARLPDRGRSTDDDDALVRGTRPYVAGDPLRSVHWPSTARTGVLTVREYEPPPRPVLLLVVDLGEGGPDGEAAASRAAWVGAEALRRGYAVVLATAEGDGPVTAPVRAQLDVSRRLAAASPGRPAPPLESQAASISITTDGDVWP
jgi:uncharacterized protein (DUF58 family)